MASKESRLKYWKAHLTKKLFFIIHYGGKCQECGIDLSDNPSMATFHHKDMSKKDMEPKDAFKLYYKDALNELDKCHLLCHNCHSEKHFNIDDWNEHKTDILKRASQVPEKSQEKSVIDPETIKKYHSLGYTVSKISKNTGYSIQAIYRILEKLSLTPNIRVAKRNFSNDEFAQMKYLRSQGYSYEKIAEVMSCSKQGVMYYKDRIN